MQFELSTFTKAKLTEIEVLSSKDREPDANPGVALKFVATMANEILTQFGPRLRTNIFCKEANGVTKQQALDGIDPVTDLPNLTEEGAAMEEFRWHGLVTGYTLVIDHGMGGKSNLEIGDCKLDGFKIEGKEGGTVVVKWNLEAPDVAEKVFGKLSKLKSQEVQITLSPPAVEQDLADQGADDGDEQQDAATGAGGFDQGTPEAALAEAAGLPR